MRAAIPTLLVALLAGCGGASEAAAPEPAPDRPESVLADCSGRSMADFEGAYDDPANLVVGPLLLVGGATPTDAETVRSVGGQKFPLLVRAGHTVTVALAREARGAGLAYGPLPQGEVEVADAHEAVTFVACGPDEDSGSTADGPVTFWSGFVVVDEPACVPLDVWVDDEASPRRAVVPVGPELC